MAELPGIADYASGLTRDVAGRGWDQLSQLDDHRVLGALVSRLITSIGSLAFYAMTSEPPGVAAARLEAYVQQRSGQPAPLAALVRQFVTSCAWRPQRPLLGHDVEGYQARLLRQTLGHLVEVADGAALDPARAVLDGRRPACSAAEEEDHRSLGGVPVWGARWCCVRLVARLGDRTDADLLQAVAVQLDEDPWVRVEAAVAHQALADEPAPGLGVGSLLDVSLPDEDESVQYAARLAALGPTTVPALVGLLGHPEYRCRAIACRALAAIGQPAIPALAATVRTAKGFIVEENARRVLGEISPYELAEVLRHRELSQRGLSRAQGTASPERGLSRTDP